MAGSRQIHTSADSHTNRQSESIKARCTPERKVFSLVAMQKQAKVYIAGLGHEAWAPCPASARCSITGEPDGCYSSATDVSADGSIVVGSFFNGKVNQAFLWQNGTMTGLGFLIDPDYKPESHAAAISANGSVVVGYGTTLKGRRACRWDKFGISVLRASDTIAEDHISEAVDVSADGSVIVGNYLSSERSGVFIWDAVNEMLDLGIVLKDDYNLDLKGWRLGERSNS